MGIHHRQGATFARAESHHPAPPHADRKPGTACVLSPREHSRIDASALSALGEAQANTREGGEGELTQAIVVGTHSLWWISCPRVLVASTPLYSATSATRQPAEAGAGGAIRGGAAAGGCDTGWRGGGGDQR